MTTNSNLPITLPTDVDTIHSRAMLVTSHISAWTARKFDRKITDEVNTKHAAVADAGRYNKHLLAGDDAKSYKAVISAATAARNTHYHETLPWTDEGWRLLPSANYFDYCEKMRKCRADFDAAVNAFVAEYPQLRENAKSKLNGMYNERDYPSVSELRRRFDFVIDFSPVPAAEDFRVQLPDDQKASIEAAITSRVEAATQAAMQDAWNRLYERVANIHERLSDPEATFRDSLIEHARYITDVLKRLNVTNDPNLETMRATVQQKLATLDPDTLRTNENARKSAAEAAENIMKQMSAFYGGGAQ